MIIFFNLIFDYCKSRFNFTMPLKTQTFHLVGQLFGQVWRLRPLGARVVATPILQPKVAQKPKI